MVSTHNRKTLVSIYSKASQPTTVGSRRFDEKSFPARAFSPKVQMELEAGSKRLVRNIEMQRRRRLYRDLNLDDILHERGITAIDILHSSALPLEIFDDEEYDCRSTDGSLINIPVYCIILQR